MNKTKKRNARKPQSRDKSKSRVNRDRDNSERNRDYVTDTEKSNTFGGNSIDWFNRNPNLLLAAGSIPYPYRPGMQVPMGQIASLDPSFPNPADLNLSIPGILALEWLPSIGVSTTPTSPASIIGKEMYAKVREKYSGALDADAPDFVIYLLALDSIFSCIAHLKRVYRTINAYSPDNRFIPDGILQALGFSSAAISDLRQNKMLLYQYINELVLMTRKFRCPRIMDLFNRHVWLNDHVYTDAPTINSQMYVFWQTGFYQYALLDEPESTSGVKVGGLEMKYMINIPDTSVVQYLYTFCRNLIDSLAESDDGYLISGYLMRAYEGVPEFTVDELLLDELLVPKYNEEVLGEIENSHCVPGGVTAWELNVTQKPSNNTVYAKPVVHYATGSVTPTMRWDLMRPRFSSRSDVPTVAETVINSRMATYIDGLKVNTTDVTAEVLSCTEILYAYRMISAFNSNSPTSDITFYSETAVNLIGGVNVDEMRKFVGMLRLAQWDWAPIIYVRVENEKFGTGSVIGDIHNITSVSKSTLYNLNTVCLYSIFNAFNQ